MSKKDPALPIKNIKLHFHEMNLQRLCLISIQRQIDKKDNHTWRIVHETPGQEGYAIECIGNPRYGIPHGHDNDFMNAVVHMFVENGAPEDGQVTATAYEILKVAGKPDNKQNYEALRESLLRLEISKYYIGRAWYNRHHRRWEVVSFSHIQQLSFTSDARTADFKQSSVIQITLPTAVVQSVRSGYLLPTNETVLRELSQPTSRSLYRLLEASRRNPENPDQLQNTLTENLLHWAQTCKIFTPRADLVRRTLALPHQELITVGYLQGVQYAGKGTKQSITYTFNPHPEPTPDARKVQALEVHGVHPGVARKYALKYSDMIDAVLTRYRQLIETGNYKTTNPAGLIVRMLQNPEDYGVKSTPPLPAPKPEKPLPDSTVTENTHQEDQETFIRYILVSTCVHKNLLRNAELDAFLRCLQEDPELMASTFQQFKSAVMKNDPQAYLKVVHDVLNPGRLFQ